jgi:colanic acid biosynthesis glycosyl transferase WcaI
MRRDYTSMHNKVRLPVPRTTSTAPRQPRTGWNAAGSQAIDMPNRIRTSVMPALPEKRRACQSQTMRILIIGISYAPEETGIAPYTTGLAEHLTRRGNVVTVITGVPSYPSWKVHPDYRGTLWTREMRNGVDVRRVRNYVPGRQSALRRGLYEASFLLGGLNVLDLPRPDAIVGVVPALCGGLLARIAARRFNSPYALLFQDLTGPAATQCGLTSRGHTSSAISATEGWAAHNAAAVGIIAEGFRPYLESLGVNSSRIHRVRNWTTLEEPKLSRSAIRRHLGIRDDVILCLHAGNMGFKQGLDNVVECARLAQTTDPKLLFALMGDGSQHSDLVELAHRYELTNLTFLPIQPAPLFSSILAGADVLLLNQRGSVTNMALPGKLTSYLASGRPIIAAVSSGSEAGIELRSTGTGLIVPPDDPTRLLLAIQALVADPALQAHLGRAGSEYARTTLTADRALMDLEAFVQLAAGRTTNDAPEPRQS